MLIAVISWLLDTFLPETRGYVNVNKYEVVVGAGRVGISQRAERERHNLL